MNAAALRETLRFVEAHLAGARRVLDVGAGRGELVQALRGRGYDAIGVDKEEGTDFLDFAGGPFDALLFVASLHHMPLAQTMEHAHRLLAPGGVLIADEFDVDAPDEATARYWLRIKEPNCNGKPRRREEREKANGSISAPRAQARSQQKGSFASLAPSRSAVPFSGAPDNEGDALREWRHHHAHHGVLASGRAMREAIAARFTLREEETAPYLYRYLPDEADADPVFAEETRLIAAGTLKPVGLRFVASR